MKGAFEVMEPDVRHGFHSGPEKVRRFLELNADGITGGSGFMPGAGNRLPRDLDDSGRSVFLAILLDEDLRGLADLQLVSILFTDRQVHDHRVFEIDDTANQLPFFDAITHLNDALGTGINWISSIKEHAVVWGLDRAACDLPFDLREFDRLLLDNFLLRLLDRLRGFDSRFKITQFSGRAPRFHQLALGLPGFDFGVGPSDLQLNGRDAVGHVKLGHDVVRIRIRRDACAGE